MSSEISTDAPASSGSEPLQPWQLFTLAGLLGATLVVFLARGQSPAAVVLLSLLVFAAAAVGVAAIKTFVSLATPTVTVGPAQILGGRTRAALEREKALVLRSIKELEFDRAMKKVSEKDFAEMSTRLRARAAGLMRQLDAGTGYREQIEQELAKRVGGAGAASLEAEASKTAATSLNPGTCASCATVNDADARFCKGCGSPLES